MGKVVAVRLLYCDIPLLADDRVGFFTLNVIPNRAGVPQSKLSGFESFEALDPAEWTAGGYAIVNVNARGVFDYAGVIRHIVGVSVGVESR